jgi:S1-C subfamily serine protease
MDGEVIGINTMKLKGTDGISFAIPIDQAKLIIMQLQRGKKVTRPYLGLRIHTVASLSNGARVVVSEVEQNSPAERAGLHKYVANK